LDLGLLLIGNQVAITPYHFFRLVADPSVNESLIDPSSGTVRTKRMPEDVRSSELFPSCSSEGSAEVAGHIVSAKSLRLFFSDETVAFSSSPTERVHAARMPVDPPAKGVTEFIGHGDIPCG